MNIGNIQILRVPHGKVQGQWCSLFISMQEADLEENLRKMIADPGNLVMTAGKD